MNRDTIRIISLLAVITTTFIVVAILQANRPPADAKLCGDYWLKCSSVNQGLYSCRIYTKDKKFIKNKAYMLPYKHWRRNQHELTDKVQKYDGDIISLDKGMKLVACEVPYQAEMIQSVGGLVWVTYEAIKEEENSFICKIYSTKNGSLISSGVYALKKYYWDKKAIKTVYMNIEESIQRFDLLYYGGVSISLNNKMVLMPDGAIDYSTDPYSGLMVKFDAQGSEISREEY